MARPKEGYFTEDGERVPSVTTVIHRFRESGGLVHWSWQCGMKGLDYREARDSAATIGTMAHEMIRAHVFGRTYDPPAETLQLELDKAKAAFDSYARWQDQSGIKIVATEQSLISETGRYGGTVDAIAKDSDGVTCVLDWKTSKGRYPEYIVQLAAYCTLVTEAKAFGDVQAAHLLWIDKESGTFAHFGYTLDTITKADCAFRLLRSLYDLDKTLKRLV